MKKPFTLRQHRGDYTPEARRQKAFAGGQKGANQHRKSVSLATVKAPTLEEIEDKYGKGLR
jgi:hypothetical protein